MTFRKQRVTYNGLTFPSLQAAARHIAIERAQRDQRRVSQPVRQGRRAA